MKREIQIIYKDVKNISIRIKPTCEVVVTAPYYVSDREIDTILVKKAHWIEKHLKSFETAKKQKQVKKLQNNEDIYFLGRKYKLSIIESNQDRIEIDGEVIKLYIEEDNFERKNNILQKWYLQQAEKLFYDLIDYYQAIVKKDIKKVRVKSMKTRWGSCNHSKGYINLNLELIKKPKEAIEYVIFHELVHLIYPNHSKDFYNYIALYMPDWKERDKKLGMISL